MASRKQSEEQKLVAFFRSPEGEALGSQGDHDGLSPAETAIRAIKALGERAEHAESMLGSITGMTRVALVASEREACAKLAEASAFGGDGIAADIRARGAR